MTNHLKIQPCLNSSVAFIALLSLLISACAVPTWTADQDVSSARWFEPDDWPPLPGDIAGQRFEVIESQSELRIIVRPAGRLARFGHPHVIGGNAILGQVFMADAEADSWFDLHIQVNELEVDRAQWRRIEGFDPELDAEAIRDTRANLMGSEILDANHYPEIRIRGIGLRGPAWAADVDVYIQIRDQLRTRRVPVTWRVAENGIEASGVLTIRQSDFDMVPFSALGGALSIADQLMIRFRIVASEE